MLRRATRGRDAVETDVPRRTPSSTSRARVTRRCSAALTDADLSTAAWPFRGVREIAVAGVPVALRADHLPRRARLRALRPGRPRPRAVRRAGRRRRRVGRWGSRRWPRCGWRRPTATSATTSTTPTARSTSGLGFAVAWDTDFRGKDALLAARPRSRSTQRLVQIRLSDPEPLLYHAEPVLRDGEVVGYVRAASYGWTLGRRRRAGLRRRPTSRSRRTGWTRAPGRSTSPGSGTTPSVSLRPMYDPTSARVRA